MAIPITNITVSVPPVCAYPSKYGETETILQEKSSEREHKCRKILENKSRAPSSHRCVTAQQHRPPRCVLYTYVRRAGIQHVSDRELKSNWYAGTYLTVVNTKTYQVYILPFFLTIFGPIYYCPPQCCSPCQAIPSEAYKMRTTYSCILIQKCSKHYCGHLGRLYVVHIKPIANV